MKKIFTIGMLLVSFAVAAMAQASAGRMVGTISSSDGVLPGAQVEVKDDATAKVINLVTNSDGSFSIPNLAVGTYTITVKADGFKTATVEQVASTRSAIRSHNQTRKTDVNTRSAAT